jgi:hypothetical protein
LAAERQALASQPSNDAERGSISAICGIDPLERGATPRAEQRLLLAVLQEAVWTFQRYIDVQDRRGRRLFGEAETWFGSDDTTWTCAFVPLCDALGFDPSYVRAGLRRWRDARPPSIRSAYCFATPLGDRRDPQEAVAAC